jgi:hypothetical protein
MSQAQSIKCVDGPYHTAPVACVLAVMAIFLKTVY